MKLFVYQRLLRSRPGTMISFVNGFLCTSSCDAAKAKRGVDPHPKTDEAASGKKPFETKNGMPDDPAVVLGGALTAAAPASAAQAAAETRLPAPGVNLLV